MRKRIFFTFYTFDKALSLRQNPLVIKKRYTNKKHLIRKHIEHRSAVSKTYEARKEWTRKLYSRPVPSIFGNLAAMTKKLPQRGGHVIRMSRYKRMGETDEV